MLSLLTAATFLCVTCSIWGLYLVWRRSRRAAALVAGRDAADQVATVVRSAPLLERLGDRARQAGLGWTARTYVVSAAIGAALGALFLASGNAMAGLLAGAAGVLGPYVFTEYRRRQRAELFAKQLPEALTLGANTIRAGGTLLHAIRAIAREIPDPVGTEFKRAEQAILLQVPAHIALDQIRQRTGSAEFTPAVVACSVAARAGADLDVVLENIGREIAEQRQFLQAMKAAASEGRMSARIVTGIPITFVTAVSLMSPGYFDPLLGSVVGKAMIGACAAVILLGVLIIRRLVDVRIW